MTEKVKKQLAVLQQKEYRNKRMIGESIELSEKFAHVSQTIAHAQLFSLNMANQKPIFYGNDMFGFNRYYVALAYVTRVNYFGNLTIDYETVLKYGLQGILEKIDEKYALADDNTKELYDGVKICFEACRKIVDEYKKSAKELGEERLYHALQHVPFLGAQNYYEACIMVRFLHFALRINGTQHIGLGRFDQYMKPYYDASKRNGETDESLLELTELFFIAMNFDTDIYFGIQQGDNGQSMVLGGVDKNGKNAFNELTEICLSAAEELKVIDPKINLRVDKNTPLTMYQRATRLTKQGLGFPQYCNDDIIIPAMTALGYEEEDARNYSVAACWEVIPSACGADIPNIKTFNFPLVIERATKNKLSQAKSFQDFKRFVEQEIQNECQEIITSTKKILIKNPFLSAFIYPCIERGLDVADQGAKYNNYGVHGAGISTAADALCAIEQSIFIERFITAEELLQALDRNFVGYERLRDRLLSCPKMGNNDDRVDNLASFLMDCFSKYLNGQRTALGGVFRAGTGSAMEYIKSALNVGATADGRLAHQPYACSFSPSLSAKMDGLLSAVQSFTKFDMQKICNGGPFTIELHDTVFRNEEGLNKVAFLVKTFVDLGGHQIQLNAVNSERLRDAQKNPELYPNMIVRVWGWSGYFNELDKEYQDHIIQRCEFRV